MKLSFGGLLISSLKHSLIPVLLFGLFSCSIATTKREAPTVVETPAPAPLETTASAEAPKADVAPNSEGLVVKMKPSDKEEITDRVFAEKSIAGLPNAGDVSIIHDVPKPHDEPKTLTTPEASVAHVRKVGAVPWSQALGWMKNGNVRFTKGRLRKDGQSLSDVKRLAAGQKPHTIVLSCSDSRVPPEIVFDEKLGELFVVRVAGEMLNSGTIGSIEYAIEHLGANLILVMGHTSCGAIKAAHATLNSGHVVSSDLDKMIEDIQPRIKAYAGKTPSEGYVKESWANVKGIAKDLIERSPDIAAAVKAGDLKIAEAMYDTTSGVVTFW